MKIQKKMLLVLTMLSFSIAIQAQIKVGDALPNITIKNTKNEEVNLSSFKGKTVLIDFWASWCSPCRLANKKLVKLYKDYGNQNFEIVGISIDTNKDKWLNAVKTDKIIYTQLIDPKGFNAKSAVRFGVDEIPTTYLFDKTGKLIAINPTEQEINNQIKKQ